MPKTSFLVLLVAAAVSLSLIGPAPTAAGEKLWHVKGVHPKGHLFDIKVIDDEGEVYDIKAIQRDDNMHLLDVKAIVGDEYKPVKVVTSEERYAPVMALGVNGRNLQLKAVTPEGKQHDVKAIRRSGSILHIRVIGIGRLYGVKAISPEGRMYDVKGVKMTTGRVEAVIENTQVHAHVKALPPAGDV